MPISYIYVMLYLFTCIITCLYQLVVTVIDCPHNCIILIFDKGNGGTYSQGMEWL